MEIFEEAHIGKCKLKNRIIRSATYEGACNENGIPTDEYYSIYHRLANGNPGLIITGFAHIDTSGKAMQPQQAGLDSEEKIPYYKKLTGEVHKAGIPIFMQLAHTGRQTLKERVTEVVGASAKKSFYFKQKPRTLTTGEVYTLADKYAQSASYAKQSGFDGIQVHAAHGYLVHQFILSSINNRTDEFGIDPETGIGTKFLETIIKKIRTSCGNDFPVIVKISGSDDFFDSFSTKQFINLVKFLDQIKIDGIEISYGTMDYALNIIRGDIPLNLILKVNPVYGRRGPFYNFLFKTFPYWFLRLKIKSFSPMYNLEYAEIARKYTSIPIISVGGFRNMAEINHALQKGINFVSLCRPFICEPDIVQKFAANPLYQSKCCNCNFCSIMCDSGKVTRCYKV